MKKSLKSLLVLSVGIFSVLFSLAQCNSLVVSIAVELKVGGYQLSCNKNVEYIMPHEISCPGANDGKLEVQFTGAVEPVRIRWSNGESSNVIENLGPGFYEVSIIDAKGCEAKANYNLTEPGPDEATPCDKNGKFIIDKISQLKLEAFPNPFSSITTVSFNLPIGGRALLEIYTLEGVRISNLFEGNAEANESYEMQFDGSGYADGVYMLQLTSPDGNKHFKKLMLMR